MESYRRLKISFLLILSVYLTSCSGTGNTTSGSNGPDPVDRVVDLSDYETFDVSGYQDEAVPVDVVVTHDVPEALMASRADAGVLQVVQGYRVQVFSSVNSEEAVLAEEELKNWWNAVSAENRRQNDLPESLTVYNHFKQPLYRVRVGDFIRRTDAERLMAYMAGAFATVFVVPDRVTVRR